MTFDEAERIVASFDEDPELEDWMPNSKVYEIIDGLHERYTPTIEMEEKDYKVFLKYKDDEYKSYSDLLDCVISSYFDSEEYELFPKLTRDMLMQAWLHPESIKVLDK